MKAKKNNIGKTILKILFCVTVLSLVALSVFIIAIVTDKNYVKFDSKLLDEKIFNTTVLDKNSQIVEANSGKNKYIPLSELKKHTIDAFISTEDKRFYKHNGIDVTRIGSALLKNFFSGRYKEGASTITQQLVKNVFLTNEKTIKRKVNELLLSLQVEKSYSKEEILEMYLNTIYFGANAYGIELASETYFGKSAQFLTLAESAGLAGMLKAPNKYSPLNNMEKYIARRNLVLDLMRDNKYIDDITCESSKEEKVLLTKIDTSMATKKSYWDAAIREACDILKITENQLANKNYIIKTFYDGAAQQVLEQSSKDEIKTLQGSNTSSCAYVVNNITGGVISYIGNSQYNITNIRRQVGSAIKPLAVYCPALDLKTISPATPILDEKVDFDGYSPDNFNNKYAGWTTIRQAVSNSINTVSVKVLNCIGVDNAIKYLNKNGIKTDEKDKNLTIALGSFYNGIYLKELLAGYLTLANSGTYKSIGFVDEIYLNNKLLYKKNQLGGAKVFRPESVYLMTDMLKTVTQTGTAKILSDLNFEVAGKTGTAGVKKGNTDVYFCGYDTVNTYLFWVGAEQSDPINLSITGTTAAQWAKDFLSTVYSDETPKNFYKPQGIVKKRLDKNALTNKHALVLANSGSKESEVYTEIFELSNSPTLMKNNSGKNIYTKIEISVKNGVPCITGNYLKENQYLYREFAGKKRKINLIKNNEVFFVEDYGALKSGIYKYYIEESGKKVSNIVYYYKKPTLFNRMG